MTTHRSRPVPASSRRARLARVSGLTGLLALGLVALLASPAAASVPVGWEEADDVSGLQFLLVLLLLPAAAFAVIFLLSFLSASRTPSYATKEVELHQGGQAWLGGPTKGVDAASAVPADQLEKSSGGAGARW